MSAVAKQKNTLSPISTRSRFTTCCASRCARPCRLPRRAGLDAWRRRRRFPAAGFERMAGADSWPEDAAESPRHARRQPPVRFQALYYKSGGRRQARCGDAGHRRPVHAPQRLPSAPRRCRKSWRCILKKKASPISRATTSWRAPPSPTSSSRPCRSAWKCRNNGSARFISADGHSTLRFVEDFMMATLSTADFGNEAALLENPAPTLPTCCCRYRRGRAEATIYTAAAKKTAAAEKIKK